MILRVYAILPYNQEKWFITMNTATLDVIFKCDRPGASPIRTFMHPASYSDAIQGEAIVNSHQSLWSPLERAIYEHFQT